MTAIYKPNNSALAKFMQSEELVPMLDEIGRRAVTYAQSISPTRTGEYKRSFRRDTPVVGDRRVAVVSNDAPHAAIVEYHLGHRVLGRTIDHVEI